jgi:hypothetical protein
MTNLNYLSGAIDASGCVGQAWELFKRNPGLYLGAGLVTLLLISCIPFVNFFLLGPMMGGFAYIVLHDLRDEPVEFGMLFKGFEKFVPLMVLGLIQAIPGIIFQIVQYTVDLSRLMAGGRAGGAEFYQVSGPQAGLTAGLIILFIGYFLFQMLWNAALTFAIPLVVEHDASIGEAIRLSFGAVFSNLGGLIVLVILNFLVALIGFCALCVGIFVAIPITFASYVIAYRHVFPYFDRSNFNVTPPPPTEYGGGYGQSY